MAAKPKALYFSSDAEANALLAREPLALLIGMLLDQQVPMEWAFMAPKSLRDRLGGALDARTIAAMPVDELVEVFCAKPALHRFPAAMAKRAHALCVHIADVHGGKPEKIWKGVATGDDLLRRVKALPGYGSDKARIFVGILGKRLGVRPEGWETAAADWASIADVDRFERVAEIREAKRAAKSKRIKPPGA